MLPLPFQFVIAMVAHAINERMARQLDYLLEGVRSNRYKPRLGDRQVAVPRDCFQ